MLKLKELSYEELGDGSEYFIHLKEDDSFWFAMWSEGSNKWIFGEDGVGEATKEEVLHVYEHPTERTRKEREKKHDEQI